MAYDIPNGLGGKPYQMGLFRWVNFFLGEGSTVGQSNNCVDWAVELWPPPGTQGLPGPLLLPFQNKAPYKAVSGNRR
jgi:hypothetical protein